MDRRPSPRRPQSRGDIARPSDHWHTRADLHTMASSCGDTTTALRSCRAVPMPESNDSHVYRCRPETRDPSRTVIEFARQPELLDWSPRDWELPDVLSLVLGCGHLGFHTIPRALCILR